MTRPLPTDAEIEVLEALAVEGETLVSRAGTCSPVFLTRLLQVDRTTRHMLLAESPDVDANVSLFALSGVDLVVEWGEWRIGFRADNPVPATHDGTDAIRVDLPETVSIQKRRLLERARVPEEAPLRCVAYSGAAAIFEGTINDVSHGGLSMLVESSGNALEPGMVLSGCRLERPGREPVIVELEVRHTATTTLPDGRRVVRAGCKFRNLTPAATKLIAEYVPSPPPGG